MKWLKAFKHPVKLLLVIALIGMFIGDLIFTDLINPASEWLYNFKVPILNISFGVFSLFIMVVWLFINKIFGNNPDS
jgi:hypothetical protein